MSHAPDGKPLDLALPLMYAASQRMLSSVYVTADKLDRFEAIRQAAGEIGVNITLLYSYWDPDQQQYFGALVLDHSEVQREINQVMDSLAQVPGVSFQGLTGPNTGLVAFEQNRLNVAGTSVSVIAQAYLGQTHRRLLEALGDQAADLLFQSGESAGQQAAGAVPDVAAELGIEVTPSVLKQRFSDLQVFGWATVVDLRVDDQFVGETLLADDFEAGAWQGQATAPVCHWIRGFLTGVLSTALGQPMQVSEEECQGKGDQYCRMTFQQ